MNHQSYSNFVSPGFVCYLFHLRRYSLNVPCCPSLGPFSLPSSLSWKSDCCPRFLLIFFVLHSFYGFRGAGPKSLTGEGPKSLTGEARFSLKVSFFSWLASVSCRQRFASHLPTWRCVHPLHAKHYPVILLVIFELKTKADCF